MGSRVILILVCILSIYFDTLVLTVDACVEDLESLIDDIKTNDSYIRELQKTFYPLNNKQAPHYVNLYYCFWKPCNSSIAHKYYWTDNTIFTVLGYDLFMALTFKLVDIGEVRELYFEISQFCNSSSTAELLLSLTTKVIFYYY